MVKIFKNVKYNRFKFRLQCKNDTYNGENRLKVTVISAKMSNFEENLPRFEAEIEDMVDQFAYS